MPSKKKPTEQELKDRLWEMVKQVDFSEHSVCEIENMPEYDKWDTDITNMKAIPVKVEGFEATTVDLRKIRDEVEGSCLTEKCKKSLLTALSKAK